MGILLARRRLDPSAHFPGRAHRANHDYAEFRSTGLLTEGVLCESYRRVDGCLPDIRLCSPLGVRLRQRVVSS